MDVENICIKFYANGGQDLDQATLIPVFQDWIKEKKIDDVMIDIADYRHVPNGPGMMLVCHNSNFGLDSAEANKLGILTQRRRRVHDDHVAEIRDVLKATLEFIHLLHSDDRVSNDLSFDLGSFEYIANDRLNIENSSAGLDAVKDDILAAAEALYPDTDINLARRENHPKSRLVVQVNGAETDLETLRSRL